MENKNYRSVTPLRKKRRKITMTAALILCLVFFVVGIACGRTATSSKQAKEANQKIQQLELDYNESLGALTEEIDTLKDDLNKKKGELAKLKKEVADKEKEIEEIEEDVEPAAEPAPAESVAEDKGENEKDAPKEKTTNNIRIIIHTNNIQRFNNIMSKMITTILTSNSKIRKFYFFFTVFM